MNWDSVSIAELCLKTSTRNPRKKANESFNYIDISSIDRDMKSIEVTTCISGAEAPSRARKVVLESDVLVSTVRPNLNAVAMVPEELNNEIASTGFCVLRANHRAVEPRYLFYFVRSRSFVEQLMRKVRGANYPAVTDRNVLEASIPYPPLTEQRRIIHLLNQVDEIRQKRVEANTMTKNVLITLFRRIFGDPLVNMQCDLWPKKRMDEVADISYGISDRLNAGLTSDDGTRILTISNVTLDGNIDESIARYIPSDAEMLKKALVTEYDLLFNWRNGSKEHVGKTAICEKEPSEETLHVSFLLRIRPNRHVVTPHYLWALMNLLRSGGYFSAQSRMQINRKFNASELSQLRVPVPPMELQNVFASHVRRLRSVEADQSESRSTIDTLLEVLLHQAFSGDLTADWRDNHKQTLAAEMKEQRAILSGSESRSNGSSMSRLKHPRKKARS